MDKEFCLATYRASHVPGQILVVAEGYHPTSGYTAWLEPERSPFHAAIYHRRPSGVVLNVLTPFVEHYVFRDPSNKQMTVWIHDREGTHELNVEPVFDRMTVDMPPAKGKVSSAISRDQAPACSEWAAWHDHMPPGPPRLHVVGVCVAPGPGYTGVLKPKQPQGVNPSIYLMNLEIVKGGAGSKEDGDLAPVHYVEPTPREYESVQILPAGTVVPVQEVERH